MMFTLILTSVTNTYQRITIAHPDYWFSARQIPPTPKLFWYIVFVGILFLVGLLALFFRFKNQKNAFRRKFFQKVALAAFLIALAGLLLTFSPLLGVGWLSARAIWLPYIFVLAYLLYLALLEYRKLPEKTARYQSEQIKKRYLRPFKKRR